MKRVYISGPITGMRDKNRKALKTRQGIASTGITTTSNCLIPARCRNVRSVAGCFLIGNLTPRITLGR